MAQKPKHFAQEAFANAHGQLRAHTHTPAGQKIPLAKLRACVREGGIWAKRAQLVLNMDH